jgi:hemoglobin
MNESSLYDYLGGAEGVRALVETFYPIVQRHPLLSPLFPEDILPVMEKQYMFLTQFFGGPALFSETYGHPMMRARHMHVEITPALAEAWLSCMKQALVELNIDPELRDAVLHRLSGPAYHFVNT